MTSSFVRAGAKKRGAGDKIQHVVWGTSSVLVGGMLLVTIIFTTISPDVAAQSHHAIAITAFLLFAAAAAVGSLLGFLFGLPRARLADQASAPANPTAISTGSGPTNGASVSTNYLTNSNLIKVSDWLTTIIIGLGLVNLSKLGPMLRKLAKSLKAPLGNYPYSATLGMTIVMGAALAGFVLAYLWTTIRFRELLEDSERGLTPVPNLTGTIGDVKQALAGSPFTLMIPKDATDGESISGQDIPAGSMMPLGTVITVHK